MSTENKQMDIADQHDIDGLIQAAGTEGEVDGYPGKRGSKRVSGDLPLDLCLNPDNLSNTWGGCMHDVSRSGLAFWSKREVRPRTLIFIREYSDNGCHPWIPATVTHCTVGIRGNLIGASFNVVSKSESAPKPAPKNPRRFNPLPPVPFVPRLRG